MSEQEEPIEDVIERCKQAEVYHMRLSDNDPKPMLPDFGIEIVQIPKSDRDRLLAEIELLKESVMMTKEMMSQMPDDNSFTEYRILKEDFLDKLYR